GRDAELGADLHDRLLLRRAGDLDVGFHFGHDVPSDWAVATVSTLPVAGERPGEAARKIAWRSKRSATAWSTSMQNCFLIRNSEIAPAPFRRRRDSRAHRARPYGGAQSQNSRRIGKKRQAS